MLQPAMSLEAAGAVRVKEEPEFEGTEHEAEDPESEAGAQTGHVKHEVKEEREWEIVLEDVKSECKVGAQTSQPKKVELGASASACGVSAAAARVGQHPYMVKDELAASACGVSAAAARAGQHPYLVKDELAASACGVSAAAARAGQHPDLVKDELAASAGACGVSAAAARASQHPDLVKQELVVGPEEIQRPKVVLVHPASLSTSERSAVAGRACSVMLEHMHVDLKRHVCRIGPYTYKFRLGWFQMLTTPQDSNMRGRTQQEYRKKNRKTKPTVSDRVSQTKVEPTRFDHAALLNVMRINFGQQCSKPYKCSVNCTYAGTTKSALQSHETTHAGEKPYKVAHCSYYNAGKSTSRDHIRMHTDEKPYKCTHCSYASTTKSALKSHETTHAGEKPYTFARCSYSSAGKSTSRHHIRMHTDEKTYKCTHCSYSSIQKSTLRDHIRTHTGEKPYKCASCSYSCATKTALKSHETKHTGEKPYKCEHCSYSSAFKSSLRGHVRIHTGDKPYKCAHCCWYSGATRSALNYHKMTRHTGL